jgi:ribosomal protein S18 acetylase RimI-like enzyme
MTLEDWESVGDMFDELDAFHRDRLPWLFQRPHQSPRDRSYFENILGDDRSTIFVAVDGKVIGFVHVRMIGTPDFPLFRPQARGLVDAIFVAPEYRGRGVAAALMRSAESWAVERGATGMDLSVHEFNEKAREAFTAMGYSTLTRRMSKPSGQRVD